MTPSVRVAPSILSADFANLEADVRRVEEAGADLLHLDVMDGKFVPNITFGPVVVEAIGRGAKRPLDVHLMIEEPIRYVPAFAAAGAWGLTVHVEACTDVRATLQLIRSHGVRPGISLRPGTVFDTVVPFLSEVDLVLVMSVEPGFGGQSYRSDQEQKLRSARDLREARGLGYAIEVDGGINAQTAPAAVAAGAEILVAGSALFGAPNLGAFIRDLHALHPSIATP